MAVVLEHLVRAAAAASVCGHGLVHFSKVCVEQGVTEQIRRQSVPGGLDTEASQRDLRGDHSALPGASSCLCDGYTKLFSEMFVCFHLRTTCSSAALHVLIAFE